MLGKEVGEQDTQGDSDNGRDTFGDVKDEVELNKELGSDPEGNYDTESWWFDCIVKCNTLPGPNENEVLDRRPFKAAEMI